MVCSEEQLVQLSLQGGRHRIGAGLCVACGYLLSVLLHGLYDSTATLFGSGDATFLLVVAVIYLIVFPVVRTMARHDRRFLY